MPLTPREINEYFKGLNKKSQKSRFKDMTKEQKSEHFRQLQRLSTAAKNRAGQARTVR